MQQKEREKRHGCHQTREGEEEDEMAMQAPVSDAGARRFCGCSVAPQACPGLVAQALAAQLLRLASYWRWTAIVLLGG
jgi:hypothetical protein